MSLLVALSEKLDAQTALDPKEVESAAAELMSAEVPDGAKADFLLALHKKGETADEVSAFARVFRRFALDPELSDFAGKGIDIVGTGGSGSGGYNVSTVTSFIVAAAGVPVLKHGNRAITSRSGSADFLGTIGVRVQADPALLRASLETIGFCFFFAPAFHPAFKEIMPVRKKLAENGQRTVFNILGPLINPAKPVYQLLGVFSQDWVNPLAASLSSLGIRRGMAVYSALDDGRSMDELSTAGLNHVAGIGALSGMRETWTAADLGFSPAQPASMNGGDAETNVGILREMMEEGKHPELADTLVLNAGAALFIAEASSSLEEGFETARDILLGGRLRQWISRMQEFYQSLPTE